MCFGDLSVKGTKEGVLGERANYACGESRQEDRRTATSISTKWNLASLEIMELTSKNVE